MQKEREIKLKKRREKEKEREEFYNGIQGMCRPSFYNLYRKLFNFVIFLLTIEGHNLETN